VRMLRVVAGVFSADRRVLFVAWRGKRNVALAVLFFRLAFYRLLVDTDADAGFMLLNNH